MRRIFFILILISSYVFSITQTQSPTKEYYQIFKHITDSILNSNVYSDSLIFQKNYSDSYDGNSKVAIKTGRLFTSTKINAVAVFSTSDTTVCLNFYEKNTGIWTLLQSQIIESYSAGPSEEFIFLNDLNGDNINEVLLLQGVFLIRTGEIFNAFILKDKRLNIIRGFENYPNPVYDQTTNRIYSYMGTSCADMTMQFITGVILESDTIISEKIISCDCCDVEDDSCLIQVNKLKEFKVKYDEAYKSVQPIYQDFLRDKLNQIRGN